MPCSEEGTSRADLGHKATKSNYHKSYSQINSNMSRDVILDSSQNSNGPVAEALARLGAIE